VFSKLNTWFMCSLRALRTLCETIFYFFEYAELKFVVLIIVYLDTMPHFY